MADRGRGRWQGCKAVKGTERERERKKRRQVSQGLREGNEVSILLWLYLSLQRAEGSKFKYSGTDSVHVTLLGTLRPDVGGGRFGWLPDDLLVVDYCNLTTPTRVLVSAPMC